MVGKKNKNALQAKGVRQFKKFHLQDERNHLHQDVRHDKPIFPNQVTHLQDERNLLHQDVLHDEPILRNQVTKGILAKLMFHQMIKVVIHKLIMMLLLIRFYLD